MRSDAFSLSILCPHCRQHTALSEVLATASDGLNKRNYPARHVFSGRDVWWMGVCNNCHKPSLVFNRGDRIYPSPLPGGTSQDVPESIRSDIDEAKVCLSVRAYRAAAVMARRAMQNAAIMKGARKEDKLVFQINELMEKGVITEDLRKWASAVRLVGNDAAHPGDVSVDKDSAEDIVELADQFMNVVFVTPALAKKAMGRREGAKKKIS